MHLLEDKNYDVMVEFFKKAGDMGYLGLGVSEDYGGMGFNFN